MHYMIRLAEKEDLAHLAEIEQAASELFVGTPHAVVAYLGCRPIEFLREQHADGRIWVAAEGEQLVGFAVVTMIDELPHLEELSVHPDHGRKGIGRRLVETVCGWATYNGFPQITLSTFADIGWNRPFYEKLGFRVLQSRELSVALTALRARESANGLNIEKRVMMMRTFN